MMSKSAIVIGFIEAMEFGLDDEYREAAIWRGLTKDSKARVEKAVTDFLEKLDSDDLEQVAEYWREDQLGHDLYFSMVGAGVGLWDRYLDFKDPEKRDFVRDFGYRLDEICQKREIHAFPAGNGYLVAEFY